MSALPSLDPADFAAFFHAVHGVPPFPWQERLACHVVEAGWPRVLDLPTGSGKTAALDVALFALACAAGRDPRGAPLRIIYVVDRRTIVDQAHKRAVRIKQALVGSDDAVVRRVRERLARYASGGAPLRTALLRGGIARDETWAQAPDQPLIAVATVDQVGSRLLFRGYGVTDSMKPVHAGLLGSDVLYLLDEVHLSQPFRETLAAIGDRYRTWAERPLPNPFVVVEMSATPGDASGEAFRLDEADRRNPVLAARLRSSKPASLASASAKSFPEAITKHALTMLDRPGATIAVVVNRVKSARELHQRLRDAIPSGPEVVHLLTGRMRPFDRDVLEARLFDRILSGRVRSPDDRPVVVVATQSIEAGADFDFDGLVTECAGLDALKQRFGRLDRLGELTGAARAVIVVKTDSLKDDPVYGDAIGKTWEWLQATAAGDTVDFGIDALAMPEDAVERGLLTPKAHAPILLPSHLDAWVQTAPIPDPDPDVSLWLHGPRSGPADVQIVWRVDLSAELLEQAVAQDKGAAEAASEIAVSMVEMLPPVGAETMSVPFLSAKRWLEGRSEPESSDVEGARDVDKEAPDRKVEPVPRAAVAWLGEQSRIVGAKDLRPGHTIVVPASYGGIEHDNWAPASVTAVTDVAELSALHQGKRPILRLHASVVGSLFGVEIGVPNPESIDAEPLSDRDAVLGWLQRQTPVVIRDGPRNLLYELQAQGKTLRVERLPLGINEDAGEYFVVVGRRRSARLSDDGSVSDGVMTDDSRASFVGMEVTLADHLAGVAETAAGFAERLGAADGLVADLRLAGEWHDAGKADPRFQRWLHGGSEFKALAQAEPLAKGSARYSSRWSLRRARERAGYPAGARHELMSLVLMDAAGGASLSERADDWGFVQHLVASHHGYCRPFAPWVPDPNPIDVVFSRDGIRCKGLSAHELARLDSGVAERFWRMVRRYGWWGLAWLEASLRLADHRQSEREQLAGGTHRA